MGTKVELYLGDCLYVLPTMKENSIDTVITDPPYGLGFMGKEWDHGVPGVVFWEAILRVAKPGAMLLAFGGTRTHHRLMCAIEDAGWEIRDCLMWLYGSGFPKSHDISKAIDKAAGAEREVVGRYQPPDMSKPWNLRNAKDERTVPLSASTRNNLDITSPKTPDAQLWDGWGTALKPAWEPIILAMKPRDGTFVYNALEHGVAGLWVDGGRIPTNGEDIACHHGTGRGVAMQGNADESWPSPYRQGDAGDSNVQQKGRWPANLILDEEAGVMLDVQSGERPGMSTGGNHREGYSGGMFGRIDCSHTRRGDTGGASRFFYCAKASRRERTCNGAVDNNHPTVKPVALMRYLCRLTKTPSGGVVLDPFMGSGSTGRACIQEGRSFIGIDKGAEEFKIAQECIAYEQVEMELT